MEATEKTMKRRMVVMDPEGYKFLAEFVKSMQIPVAKAPVAAKAVGILDGALVMDITIEETKDGNNKQEEK